MNNKINLGSGDKYLKGFINCDVLTNVKSDKVFDLNTFPYPFKSNYADEIRMDNVLEHLDNIVDVMRELHRILKKNGKAIILVPYGRSDGAIQDPTHKHFFIEKSMNYFADNFEYNYYSDFKFNIKVARLFTDDKTLMSKIRTVIPFRNILKHFLFNMYDGIYFELEAIKK